ncbi:uncharacterized protein LOC117899382 [Drosophila subobscura]|uniref:uncharacterized protein LOC117899382 n=1 Tax=Drosophila subobscura TaxID=7241 RepID=UPI00155A521B|nr:uncharacterized protein LOC117899382 [Drosophila subobscura]
MGSTYILLVQLILFLHLFTGISSEVEFTNIKCTSLDKEFNDFEYCHLKSVNRSYKYVSVKVKLYKVPITKVKVNFALLKRFSGYEPFLYNITVDACKALRNSKSNPMFFFFHEIFRSHSNMNHTCPFDHDLAVDKVSVNFINRHFTEVLPFPRGEYLFQSNWFAYNVIRAEVKFFFTLF